MTVSRHASSALYWRSMARFPTGRCTTDSPPRHGSTPGAAIARATPGVLDGATSSDTPVLAPVSDHIRALMVLVVAQHCSRLLPRGGRSASFAGSAPVQPRQTPMPALALINVLDATLDDVSARDKWYRATPGAAPGPRPATRQGVAHALLPVLPPSPLASARGTPRRPLSSQLSLYQSGAESLNGRAIERSVRTMGHRRRLDRSPRLRTTARTHVVPVFVLDHCGGRERLSSFWHS